MIEKLKRRIPDARDEQLLADLLADAAGVICACTLRREVPSALEAVQIEIAAMIFNRMGMEGESSHGEGSVSHSVDSLPEYIRMQLAPWRLAKAVNA